MSFYNTQDLPNFSVYPSRDQRAPYGTIQNIPIIQAIDQYAFNTIPIGLVQDGTFLVLQGDYPINLPGNTTLFKFFGGHKYLSNGDIQSFTVINRGTDSIAIYNPDNESYDVFFDGECGCLVIQWTTTDQAGNRLPTEDCYYTILPSNFLLLAQQKGKDINAKLSSSLKKPTSSEKLSVQRPKRR